MTWDLIHGPMVMKTTVVCHQSGAPETLYGIIDRSVGDRHKVSALGAAAR